jgi:hypothetical protein
MHLSRLLLQITLPPALGSVAFAQTWTESGDARNLPGTAQVCTGTGALTTINGNFNDPNEALGPGNDKDMYLIQIDTPASFSASTVGGATVDTQLFLFDENGRGVTFNDDASATTQSRLTNQFVTAAGRYYLAVSKYDRDATAGGQQIWLDSPFGTERQPDGPGAAGVVDGWNGESSDTNTDPYTITLAGCSFVVPNALEIYPNATSFTSRGSNTGGVGEVIQGWHGSHWGSIGDSGAISQVVGLTYVTQDQNAASVETYDVVVRSGTDAAGPTPGAPGELASITGLSTPGGVGTLAWIVTADFSTPCVIPQKAFVSAGIRLGANPAWPTDGQSVHATAMALQQSGTHQEDHGWQIQAGTVSHPTQLRTWRVALRTLTPLLQNGVFATGTSTYARGMGGMFPRPGHGWSTHIRAGTSFGSGFAAIFLGTSALAAGVPIAGIDGNLCILGTIVPFPLVPLDASGNADVKIIDPLGTYGTTTVYLQAVVASPAFALHFTNMNGATLQ